MKVHWLLAAILVFPVYVVMLNLFGFLTLPLYFLTPERKVASNAWNAIEKGDKTKALRILEEYENVEPTSSNDDFDNTNAEVGTKKEG